MKFIREWGSDIAAVATFFIMLVTFYILLAAW